MSTDQTRTSRGGLFRRWLLLVVLSGLGLQLYFVARVIAICLPLRQRLKNLE